MKRTNLVVLSDHGLINTSHEKFEFLDDYINVDLMRKVVFSGSFAWIYPFNDTLYQVAVEDSYKEIVWGHEKRSLCESSTVLVVSIKSVNKILKIRFFKYPVGSPIVTWQTSTLRPSLDQ